MLLTHFPIVPLICVNEVGHHWFRYGLGSNRRQANASLLSIGLLGTYLTRNSIIFIQGKAIENVFCQNVHCHCHCQWRPGGDDLIYTFQTAGSQWPSQYKPIYVENLLSSTSGRLMPKCSKFTNPHASSWHFNRWIIIPLDYKSWQSCGHYTYICPPLQGTNINALGNGRCGNNFAHTE